MDSSIALHYERLAQERRKRNASPYARPVFDSRLGLTVEALLDCAESLGVSVIPNGDTLDFNVRWECEGQELIACELLERKREIIAHLAPESQVVIVSDEISDLAHVPEDSDAIVSE